MRPTPRSTLFPYTTLFRSRAVEQVAAAVQVAVALKFLAERPEVFDLVEDLRGQAVGEIDEVVYLQVLADQLRFAELVQRSEEHTSELQSRGHLVCRLLLEK